MREAMIVEAIGEVAKLVQRVDELAPAIDASRGAVIHASAELAGHLVAFENRMTALTDNAKMRAVRHIAHRTDEIARGSLQSQARAMEEAAREVFQREVGPALQRLVGPLQLLANRSASPWSAG